MSDQGITEYLKEHRLSKVLHMDTYSSCQYYDDQQFNNLKNVQNSQLNVYVNNIRSLPLHGTELKLYLSCLKAKFNVIILTEIGAKNR